jgi:hypothetical protein
VEDDGLLAYKPGPCMELLGFTAKENVPRWCGRSWQMLLILHPGACSWCPLSTACVCDAEGLRSLCLVMLHNNS